MNCAAVTFTEEIELTDSNKRERIGRDVYSVQAIVLFPLRGTWFFDQTIWHTSNCSIYLFTHILKELTLFVFMKKVLPYKINLII